MRVIGDHCQNESRPTPIRIAMLEAMRLASSVNNAASDAENTSLTVLVKTVTHRRKCASVSPPNLCASIGRPEYVPARMIAEDQNRVMVA